MGSICRCLKGLRLPPEIAAAFGTKSDHENFAALSPPWRGRGGFTLAMNQLIGKEGVLCLHSFDPPRPLGTSPRRGSF